MRDAIELEWAGIPSVAIIHEALAGSADSMKRLSGVKDYDYVEVKYPHIPTAVWTDEEARSIAKDLDPDLADLMGYSMGNYALGYYSDPDGMPGPVDLLTPEIVLGRKPTSKHDNSSLLVGD